MSELNPECKVKSSPNINNEIYQKDDIIYNEDVYDNVNNMIYNSIEKNKTSENYT